MRNIKGGAIHKNPIYSKIISIGYELETSSIAKFTKISIEDDVLLNTDTAGKDLEKIRENAEDPDYALRQEELVEIDAYTTESIDKKKKKVDKNIAFLISNDVSTTRFTKNLTSYCKDDDAEEGADDIYNKDELYTFHTNEGEIYRLNFDTWAPKDCGIFTDVEWICTYYKPQISDNIMIDTFANLVKNLIIHLNKLEKAEGKLIINFSETDKEVVKTPETRSFFHLPDTNLYFMQTQYLDELLDVDDICISPQMTFACKIVDMIDIFKTILFQDFSTIPVVDDYRRHVDEYLRIMENVDNCVNVLFDRYNSDPKTKYKILDDVNPELVKSMKACLFLILYKIHRYLNGYLLIKDNSKKTIYLKASLFFNSRHSNESLYKELKKFIAEHFASSSISEESIAEIIQTIVINPGVLEEYLLEKPTNIRKNAFSLKSNLEDTHPRYGDPFYSLVSYFKFFENPVKTEETFDTKDWLVYKDIDIYSSQSDIKDGIVLIEFRAFFRMLSAYFNEIADKKMLKSMTKGACNRAQKSSASNLNAFTVETLKLFVKHYDSSKRVAKKTKKENEFIMPTKSARKFTLKKRSASVFPAWQILEN